jgi:hypothetical protein
MPKLVYVPEEQGWRGGFWRATFKMVQKLVWIDTILIRFVLKYYLLKG